VGIPANLTSEEELDLYVAFSLLGSLASMRFATERRSIFDVVFLSVAVPTEEEDAEPRGAHLEMVYNLRATRTTVKRMRRAIALTTEEDAYPSVTVSIECEGCRPRPVGEEMLVTRTFTLVSALRNFARHWTADDNTGFDMVVRWMTDAVTWNLEWEQVEEPHFVSRRVMEIEG
jgi:hypothetical protein